MISKITCGLALAALVAGCHPRTGHSGRQPNIVLIYADDLGYGDVGYNGAVGVSTPHIDRLAQSGMRFTDAHSTASTCTPSRFSLLTGSYAFRNNAAILPGSAPLLIRPGTPTLPGMLRRQGYRTAVIGKWHLGLGSGAPAWNGELKPGPLETGFDYSFIIPATLDRVPTVFVKNHRVLRLDTADPVRISYEHPVGNLPTGLNAPRMLKMTADSQHSGTIVDSISRIGYMSGGRAAWWKDEDIAGVLVDQVRDFIGARKDSAFFLYFALTDIHVPRAPNPRFAGKSTLGPRGDAIAQMDWSVGEVMKILKDNGLTGNMLVLFTSDNGPVLDDGYADSAEQRVGRDRPWGPFGGGKYSALEAGTRVPMIVSWPGTVPPGSSDALVSQVDFYASFANLTGHTLQGNEAPDSYDVLEALMGKSALARTELLEESYTLSLREDAWKYIAAQDRPTPAWLANKHVATGLAETPQLYYLRTDTAEQHNRAKALPARVQQMEVRLREIEHGPTRPGYTG